MQHADQQRIVGAKTPKGTPNWRVSLYFPIIRDSKPETGSPLTASAATTKYLILRRFLGGVRFEPAVRFGDPLTGLRHGLDERGIGLQREGRRPAAL